MPFFNEDDTDCDQTTFQYSRAGYQPQPNDNNVLLTTTVRKELNALVAQLNSVISAAVEDVNVLNAGQQVHFVDITPTWVNNQHRWCEAGNFHEPDQDRLDTWFFLSGWKDVNIETNALDTVCPRTLFHLDQRGIVSDANITQNNSAEAQAEQAEIEALIKAKSYQLPDANTCNSTLGTDPDPWVLWTCRLSMEAAAEPNGTIALGIKAANTEIAAGDVNGLHVPWYVPTRQIKTFHPRSPGMVGYRDAIIAAINSAQVNTASTSSTTLAPKSTAPPKPTTSASATTGSPLNRVGAAFMGGVFSALAPEVSQLINGPREKCNTNYKFLWDTFDIYGYKWDESKLDAGGGYLSGNGLLTQLRGCSDITKWSFQNMTVGDNQPYEWHASGRTTIWQKNCIEHAMLSAGASADSCSGSG